MRTPSLLRMLPTVLCRKELWMGADRATIAGEGTVMTVEFWHCIIAAFDQRDQATRPAWQVLGMAHTGRIRTWMKAEAVPGRDCREKKSTGTYEE